MVRYEEGVPGHRVVDRLWDAFEVANVDTNDSATVPDRLRTSVLATPVRYVGMPAPRWWEWPAPCART